jgi:nucleoside-diphosphate-sugar epimerase
MIIGRGLVARNFGNYAKNDDFLVFASGVSHSKQCSQDDFKREHDLLLASMKENPDKKLVYFSTSSVSDPDLLNTAYIRHKLAMEELVRQHASLHHVFRLSNLAGISNNPSTVLNFFYSSIEEGRVFELWKNSERNIIDVEDAYKIADHILRNALFLGKTVNIANQTNYPVQYIVDCIESFCGRKAIFTPREKGGKFRIDISETLPICRLLKIDFSMGYLPGLLEKYYGRLPGKQQ